MTRDVIIRLSVQNETQASRALAKVGGATDKTSKSTGKLSVAFRKAGDSAALITGPLGGVASRISIVGRALQSVNPLLAAAAIGFTGLTFGLVASARASAEAEKQLATLESLVKVTGGTAGFSAKQINAFAFSLGKATLASTQNVREAAAQLLTFKSISGETFTRTLELAQDLAALGFGSIQTAAVQLAKALDDPTIGLTSLRRVGVSFTKDQQELIKSLNATGQAAQAQTVILDVLEGQVGGSGVAQAGGLAGAADTLGEEWTHLLEVLGDSGPAEAAAGGIRVLSGAIAELGELLEDDDLETRFERLLAKQQDLLRAASPTPAPGGLAGRGFNPNAPQGGGGDVLTRGSLVATAQQRELAQLSDFQRNALELAELRTRLIGTGRAPETLRLGEIDAGATEEELAKIVAAVEKFELAVGGLNLDPVQKTIRGYNLQLFDLEDALKEAGASQEQTTEIMGRARGAVAALIEGETALARALEVSTAAQAEEIVLTGRTQALRFKGRDARIAQIEADKEFAKVLKDDLRTPMDIFAEQLERIERLTRQEVISTEEATRARALFREELDDATGATRRFEEAQRKLERQQERNAKLLAQPFENALRGVQSGFTTFFETVLSDGKLTFGDLADAFKTAMIRAAAELASLQLMNQILGAGSPGSGGGFFGFISGLFGSGASTQGGGAFAAGAAGPPAASTSGAGLGGIAAANPYIGLGILDFSTGIALGSAIGGNTKGATIGALTSNLVGIPAIFGGLIGGFIGGTANNGAGQSIDLATGEFLGSSGGGANARAARGFARQIASLAAAVNAIEGVDLTGGVRALQGDETGRDIRIRGRQFNADSDRRAIRILLREFAKQIADPAIGQIIRRVDKSSFGAAVGDIGFIEKFLSGELFRIEPLGRTEQELIAINAQFDLMVEQANRLRLSTVELETTRAAAIQRTLEAAKAPFEALLESLDFGALSFASPTDALAKERARFEEISAAAVAGDPAAQARLAAVTSSFISASRLVNASGGTFQDDLAFAVSQVEGVIGGIGALAHGPSAFTADADAVRRQLADDAKQASVENMAAAEQRETTNGKLDEIVKAVLFLERTVQNSGITALNDSFGSGATGDADR